MHAVIVRAAIKQRDEAEKFLKEQIVPRLSNAPGFVRGSWVNLGDKGTSMIVFESEDAAREAADQIAEPPAEAAEIESVEVGEVVAEA